MTIITKKRLIAAGVLSAPAQECLRLADCYHRLIYYDRSNGSLNVDSFPLAGGPLDRSPKREKNRLVKKPVIIMTGVTTQ
jgi:hypothetical protein